MNNILIEFNIAKEENKYGFTEEEIEEAFVKASTLNNINVKGVMCMAPFTDDENTLVNVFRKLRKIYENCGKIYNKYDNINKCVSLVKGNEKIDKEIDKNMFEEIVRLDVEYIENWSVGLDIKILLKTVLTVFMGSGAR